ncbi:protein of unknown function [Streptococcus thermophilus]|nr:protein of unknown function [Streptococcus thermophilus]
MYPIFTLGGTYDYDGSFWWAHWPDIWIHFATNSFLLDWWFPRHVHCT